MATAVKEAVAEIASKLADARFGELEVRDVRVGETLSPEGDPQIRFLVIASDPDPEAGTWSTEDVFQLRSRLRELAAQSEVDLPTLLIDLHPETEDDAEQEDDESLDSDLAERLDNDIE